MPPTVLVRPDDPPILATILSAAVEVMSRHGYDGSSIRDVAAAAGISAGHVYNHVHSKHELLQMIADRAMDLLLYRAEAALVAASAEPVARLNALVEVHVRTHTESPRESLLINSELRSLQPSARALVVSKRDADQRMFDRVVADGVQRLVFDTPYPADASRWIVSACTAVGGWYHEGGGLDPEELVVRYQRLALDSVGYRAAR